MNSLPRNLIIIGAGRIAYSIANAVKDGKYESISVLSKSLESAKILAEKYSFKYHYNDYNSLNKREAIFLLTVPDEQIIVAAEQLSKNSKIDFSKSLFIHFSGALSLEMLNPVKLRDANIASIHIMQTFHSRKAIPLNDLFCAVETENEQIEDLVFQFAESLKLKPKKINSEDKSFYHLAGVFASNFLFSSLYFAEILMDKSFAGDVNSPEILGSLINSSLTNAKNYGIENSITGPLVRGDLETIRKHISAIDKLENNLLIKHAYVINSLNLLNIIESHESTLTYNQKAIKDFLKQFNYI
ncbi:MAG: DUF2520 domain-containing protein [Bacteroidota bacterium]|nr:DUF2520 domain-containing protein [Bacteroidota bacterium]